MLTWLDKAWPTLPSPRVMPLLADLLVHSVDNSLLHLTDKDVEDACWEASSFDQVAKCESAQRRLPTRLYNDRIPKCKDGGSLPGKEL